MCDYGPIRNNEGPGSIWVKWFGAPLGLHNATKGPGQRLGAALSPEQVRPLLQLETYGCCQLRPECGINRSLRAATVQNDQAALRLLLVATPFDCLQIQLLLPKPELPQMLQFEIFISIRTEQPLSGGVCRHGGVRHEQRHLPTWSRCCCARHPFISRVELGAYYAGRWAAKTGF